MEPPSAPPRGGRVPWQEVLLAVSLLTFWNPPTTAQVTVESVPPSVAEGKDVLLLVHNLPGDPLGYGWFRGETVEPSRQIVSYAVDTQVTTPGPAHSRRETIYPNGSLLFQNINLKDTGHYTVQITKRNFQVDQGTGQFRVFQPVARPTLHASNTTVTRNKDSVVLTCSTNNTGVSIGWLFNNQSLKLTERMKLSQDNSTLTIDPVRKEDAGNYQCEVSNPGSSSQSDPVRLAVEELLARPTLHASNTTVTGNKDSVVLTCSTNNTGVSIGWLFNNQSLKLTERMKLSQDNSTLTIGPVRKEDAGNYQCEVSNPGSSSQSDPVRLAVEGDLTQPNSGLPPGAIVGIVIGVLAGVVVIAALVYFLFIRKTGGASDLRDVTEHKPSASNHSQDHADNLSNKIEEVAYSSLNFNAQEPKKSTSAPPSPAATETVYTEVQKK
ncbi:cell adhesion molecule CEACAM1-like isoform X1 [Halichoerus grypus]